jgi:hypothetical protein
MLLRRIRGPVVLRPKQPELGKPYYEAETTLQVVDLSDDPEGGSNWLRKWTRTQPIRTFGQIAIRIPLVQTTTFSYQRIADRAAALRRLGLADSVIARSLRVADKTVAKAIRWRDSGHTGSKS